MLIHYEDRDSLMPLPNLRTYGVINVVIKVTMPIMGKTDALIAPVPCPTCATTNDSSPLADDIASPVLRDVSLSYFEVIRRILTIRNFEANEIRININAGTMKKGIRDTSINAPIDIKNIAANISLNGTVITRDTCALLDSAINTPARNAPVATDNSRYEARKDNPKAKPSIEIRSKA
jgi:hypothetical protein